MKLFLYFLYLPIIKFAECSELARTSPFTGACATSFEGSCKIPVADISIMTKMLSFLVQWHSTTTFLRGAEGRLMSWSKTNYIHSMPTKIKLWLPYCIFDPPELEHRVHNKHIRSLMREYYWKYFAFQAALTKLVLSFLLAVLPMLFFRCGENILNLTVLVHQTSRPILSLPPTKHGFILGFISAVSFSCWVLNPSPSYFRFLLKIQGQPLNAKTFFRDPNRCLGALMQ